MMHEIHKDPIRHYPHLIQTLAWHLAVKLMKQELHAEFLKLGESEARRRGRIWPLQPKPTRLPKFV
jgi:hypothetical protein